MSNPDTEAAIQSWAAERRLDAVHLERWLRMPERDRLTLLHVARLLRFRSGQLAKALELLDEIAVRDGQEVVEILARPKVRAILDGPGSAPGRARALLDHLRELRFPALKKSADALRAAIAELALPAAVRLLLPKDLASDELCLEISARGGLELGNLLRMLARKEEELVRIAEMLGGEDEV